MPHGIRPETVLTAPGGTFRMRRILNGGVMDLMPAMEVPQHFERADLPPFGSGVHEIRVHPEDFHCTRADVIRPSRHVLRLPLMKRLPQICRFKSRQMRSVASSKPLRWRTNNASSSLPLR